MYTSLATLLLASAGAVTAIDTISTVGNKFFTSSGKQWFIKGIAYQLVPQDPLIDTNQCNLDASLMQTLGANAIRVYHVDPNGDHDGCMQAFSSKGIYTFIDLDTFDTQIEQIDPHWNSTQLEAFERVMDAFHSYDNVAGFFIGNEVLTTGEGSPAAPYVKAATRDLKAYRDSKGYRKIPVGYSAADISSLRPMLQNYLACGTNASEAIDFFALNAYEWCGDHDLQTSGYSTLNSYVQNTGNGAYSIPIFFSETGCNTSPPRTFQDQSAIFGDQMNPYWSGSIIYEWIQETNGYGLVQYGPKVDPASPNAPPEGYTRSGTPMPITPDFTNLQSQWKTLNPTGVSSAAYTPSLTPPPCPSSTASIWEVNGNPPLPTVGQSGRQVVSVSATSTGTAKSTSTIFLSSRTASAASWIGQSIPTGNATSFTGGETSYGSSSSITGSNILSSLSTPASVTAASASVGGSSLQDIGTASAASASATKGAASPAREIMGGFAGLVSVLIGAVWFL